MVNQDCAVLWYSIKWYRNAMFSPPQHILLIKSNSFNEVAQFIFEFTVCQQ